jgi:hypothetical protein
LPRSAHSWVKRSSACRKSKAATHGHRLPPVAILFLVQFAPPPRWWLDRPSSEGACRRHVSKPVHGRAHRRNVSVCRGEKNGTVPFPDRRARTHESRSGQRKALHQIPRILWATSLSAHEGIERAPINLSQLRQCIKCVSGNCRRIARFKDY